MSSYQAYSGNGIDQIDPFDAGDSNLWRKAEYLGRYLFAVDFLRPHKPDLVVDISCGLGYGAAQLCSVAGKVIGVDENAAAIAAADAAAAAASVFGLNRAGCSIATGTAWPGATMTRMPSFVMPNSRSAKS